MAGCTERPANERVVDALPPIFPDYIDVTIPTGIAPLNFCIDSVERLDVVVKGSAGGEMLSNDEIADFDIEEWKALLDKNVGGDLMFSVSAKKNGEWIRYTDFQMHVSPDALDDFGVVYRKIQPGYETFSNIGIYQRDIHSFEEYPVVAGTAAPAQCINCHAFKGTDPSCFSLHFRGNHSATLLQLDNERRWLNTKTDETIANCMYPYWHPSGNYCAYSLNLVHQCFFTSDKQLIEVFDKASDAVILDVRTNELILSPIFQTEDFETYPVFTVDGKTIYYCTSKKHNLPDEHVLMRYDLCKVSFDPEKGGIGNDVDTVLKVSDNGKCITFPKPSHDGKYLMYCLADNGIFPINHKEADLWLMNLSDGTHRPLDEVNSDDTESYHSWSTNSHWFVFSSRRGDGLFSRLYIANIDENGKVGKPFMLPQRSPKYYYDKSPYAYNVPEFVMTKIEYDAQGAYDELASDKRIQVTIKK